MKRSVFLCLILAAATPFFFLYGPNYFSPRSYKAGWDLGHILYFSLLTLLTHKYLILKKPEWPEYKCGGLLFLAVFVVGVCIELLQTLETGRSPDVYDILRNQLGCLLGFSIASFFSLHRQQKRWRFLLHGIVLVGLIFAFIPFVRSVVDEQRAVLGFPVLADFEHSVELTRWMRPQQMKLQGEIVRHGKQAAKIQLTTAKYSGASFCYFPGNWQGYTCLHFSVYNPDEEMLNLHFRAHDLEHRKRKMPFGDRFHTEFHFGQGWHDISIPLSQIETAPAERLMDLTHMENMAFFVMHQHQARIIYLDQIYLTR